VRQVASWIRGLRVAAAAALAGVVAGCAAPQFTYIADSSAQTYFKVPYHWHQVTSASLTAELKNNAAAHGIWEVGYDAALSPSAGHVLAPSATEPFTLAMVLPLSAAGGALSDNSLRDAILPVTAAARLAAAQHGFRLTGFRVLRDNVLTLRHGIHGVREIVDYTFPNGYTDTFDKVVLTNAHSTQVYVLVAHCLASCYRQDQKEIDTVMTSFTVGNP
jgi:hypothetical protein